MTAYTLPKRDLSVMDACAILGITPPTLYKLINQEKLKSYKIGRARRITFDSLEKLRASD